MNSEDVVIVNKKERLAKGLKDAVYSRVCNEYKCELVPLNVEKHGVDKNKLIITGLAITQSPREGIYIPKETFEKYGNTLVGRPLADGHGLFPWSDITVDEVLGVVVEEWFDDKYEAQMFKAEVWDDNAIQVLKKGVYNKFSVAYYYDYEMDKMLDEYDEEIDVRKVTEMEYDHIAFLNTPQVPEAEVKEIEELNCSKNSYMDADLYESEKSGNTESLAKTYYHNSMTKKEEPDWGDVDKKRLPWKAFGNWKSMDKDKKSTWKYPHHWISLGKMYLHRGGLVYALAAAKGARSGKKASPEIFEHLNKHVKAIKLSSEELKDDLMDLGLEDPAIEEIIADLYKTEGDFEMKDEEEVSAEEKDTDVDDNVEEDQVEEQTDEKQTEESTEEENSEEQEEEVVEEHEEEESTDDEPDANTTQDDSSVVEKLSKMSVEINEKNAEIAGLKEKLSKLEKEKLEKEISERVEKLTKEGKITPAKKEDTIALYKGMDKKQWENFEKVLETKIPVGEESAGMDDDRSDKNESDKPEKKGFFN